MSCAAYGASYGAMCDAFTSVAIVRLRAVCHVPIGA